MKALFRFPIDAWAVAFMYAVVSLLGALILLFAALLRESAPAEPGAVFNHTQRDSTTALPIAHPERITVSGRIPPTLASAGFSVLPDGGATDVTFAESVDPADPVVEFLAPVVAMFTGVDSLSSAQLAGLMAGSITDWREVGGLPGPVRTAIRLSDGSYRLSAAGQEELVVPTADNLVATMSSNSGIIALVPVASVRPAVMPVAIDGVDIVRGRGEASAWSHVRRSSATAGTRAGRAALPTILVAMTARAPQPVIVVVTGDILQSRCSLVAIQATGDWGAALRGPVGEYLARADLTLGSLDGSIQDVSVPLGCIATTNLTSPPQVVEALVLAGFDEMTIATNHIFDCGAAACGRTALLQTIEFLGAAGIKTVGGGANLEAALAPAVFEVRGLRIGVLGFDDVAALDLEATADSPGTAPLDDDYKEERAAGEPAFFRPAGELSLNRFTERIRKLKSEVDIVVVQVQSGIEDTHTPSPRSIKALRAAADAGADLIVGNQAHWVQAVELRSDAFIAYALGNFIFDQVRTVEHTQGYLLEATFLDKRLTAVRFVPYQIENRYKPTFVEGERRLKILSDVFEATKKLLVGP